MAEPHPLTTIFGQRASNHVGDASFDPGRVPWTGGASDTLTLMTAESPFRDLAPNLHREFIRHAAVVMLLRDLYHPTASRGDRRLRPPGQDQQPSTP